MKHVINDAFARIAASEARRGRALLTAEHRRRVAKSVEEAQRLSAEIIATCAGGSKREKEALWRRLQAEFGRMRMAKEPLQVLKVLLRVK